MEPTTEMANAMAVRCLCTATHMRSFLGNGHQLEQGVRRDLTTAVDLLETVCSEIEESAHLS